MIRKHSLELAVILAMIILLFLAYGCGGSSTLTEMSNSNNPLLKDWWVNHYIIGGGKILNGLISRRKAEAKLYFFN